METTKILENAVEALAALFKFHDDIKEVGIEINNDELEKVWNCLEDIIVQNTWLYNHRSFNEEEKGCFTDGIMEIVDDYKDGEITLDEAVKTLTSPAEDELI